MRSMPFDPSDARRWLNDMLHHIAMAEGFVVGVTSRTIIRGLMR
jgi:hypothetical protein